MENNIKNIAVIGAGTMGQGIAQVCATAGYRTGLFDVNHQMAKNGLEAINTSLALAVKKGKITEKEKENIVQRITVASTLAELQVDLVIEAIVEKIDIKQALFKELELHCKQECIFASNTSSISITQMASVLKNPSRCVGLHFFNPATAMKLVEVIGGAATNTNILVVMKAFVKSINKIAVAATDSPGFIVNRVARQYYVEALKLLEENVSTYTDIDKLMRSAGFKMGPFELMDLIGMDVNFAVTASMYEAFHQDPKFRPSRIQQQKVMAGYLGRKTGKGFYEYDNKK